MIQAPGRPDTAEASVAVADAWQGRGLETGAPMEAIRAAAAGEVHE
jgi:hypothetical protein